LKIEIIPKNHRTVIIIEIVVILSNMLKLVLYFAMAPKIVKNIEKKRTAPNISFNDPK
jgi:fumarate reductase subunit C